MVRRRAVTLAGALTVVFLGGCALPAATDPSRPSSRRTAFTPAFAGESPRDTSRPADRAFECVKAGIRYPHNPAVRVEAVEAMESADPDAALPWIQSALLDEHPAVRFAACVAIGNACGERPAPTGCSLAAIENRLHDENPSVRVAALYARHRLGRTDQTGKLATYLLQHDNPTVRRNAALVLGLLGESGATPVLARAVRDDPDPGVRHHALEAMARLGNMEACQELSFLTNSGVGSEEVMAVQALAATRDPRFLETYEYKLATATHIETRLAAARALGMLRLDAGALPGSDRLRRGYEVAMRGLAGEFTPVRDENDPPAGQALRVRLLAAAALGAIGREDAVDALSRLIEGDPDPRIQVAAARAVLDIVGARRASPPDGRARRGSNRPRRSGPEPTAPPPWAP